MFFSGKIFSLRWLTSFYNLGFKKVFKYRQEKNPELLPEIDQDLQNLKNLGAFGLARMIDIFLTNYK